MDGCAVPFIHLVEFINAADPLVSQHQRSTLQHLCTHMHHEMALCKYIHMLQLC